VLGSTTFGSGTFGATGSGATNIMDEYFSGSGIITVVLPGDFNGDNKVDAADYVYWRKNGLSAQDYQIWRTHFGQTAGSGAGAIANAAVPEPATIAILIVGMLGMCLCRRRAAML
jgi:hypothetical protein